MINAKLKICKFYLKRICKSFEYLLKRWFFAFSGCSNNNIITDFDVRADSHLGIRVRGIGSRFIIKSPEAVYAPVVDFGEDLRVFLAIFYCLCCSFRQGIRGIKILADEPAQSFWE